MPGQPEYEVSVVQAVQKVPDARLARVPSRGVSRTYGAFTGESEGGRADVSGNTLTSVREARMLSTRPAERLFRSYDTVRQEVDQDLEIAEGKIPEDLRGVLFRNGSGRMERGGIFYGHPFDGDGMLSRFAFTGKGIRYRNRFVRTRWYLDEENSGRIRYRNFGTNIPGGLLNNAFRTNCLPSVRPERRMR
jgi:hypothetical protein